MWPLQKSNLLKIALFVLPLLAAGPVIATVRDEVPSTTVRYRDLNLNSAEGIARLYERIRVAAADVCRTAAGLQPLNRELTSERDACIGHAVAHAVHVVHNEKLSALHWERIRGPKFHWVAELHRR